MQPQVDNTVLGDDCLSKARALVAALESGDHSGADMHLAELSKTNESRLFCEIGQLTREVHESLTTFTDSAQLSNVVQTDIPDAKDRIRYVIDATNEAAHKTLTVVETLMPIAKNLKNDASTLHSGWREAMAEANNPDEVRRTAEALRQFLAETEGRASDLSAGLNEVLMAQGFQDLTSQVLGKVVETVQSIEEKLVRLVRVAGHSSVSLEPVKSSTTELAGPAITDDDAERANSQDEVDDLLSSLGF